MNVALTPELEEFIRRKLATGMYKNASEVVREGLRRIADEDAWTASVRGKIAKGVAQAKGGQLVDGAEAFKKLRQRVEAHRKRGG